MLISLSVRNIALIEKVNIELGQGFHAITGETGAGKSILVDSLNLLLGERADKEMVRTGTDKGYIEGVFDISDSTFVQEQLKELGIEYDENLLVVSRELSAEGKSVCRLNGRTVTLSALKKITDHLADIHGQHEHQSLLMPEKHLQFLDSFGGAAIKAQRQTVGESYKLYQQACHALQADWGTEEERARRIDILTFQIDEIFSASLKIGEEEEIRARLQVLQNTEKISQSCNTALEMLRDGNHAAIDQLRVAVSTLQGIADLDEQYGAIHARVENLYYELEDAGSELRACLDNLDADPRELDTLEDRLTLLKKLYRKYGGSVEQVLAFCENADNELCRLQQAKETIERLEQEKQQAYGRLLAEAVRLSELRKETAVIFEKRVIGELSDLGMPHSLFIVQFAEQTDAAPRCTAEGFDQVEFLLSPNAGEPPKSLSKIISGGEMSRFMLALKSIAADDAMLPTMVFDEIDTGISGKMAQVTAEKIAGIAKKHQVLCVTHLPQIAAMADIHFLISKDTVNGSTITSVQKLTEAERVFEIARLAGGGETELAQQHAKEMLENAEKIKKSTR